MPRGHILDTRWNALLSDFRRSGLTHAEFCRRRGISIHSFRKHLYQTPAPKPTHPDLPATASVATPFLPVTILADPAPTRGRSHQPLELILPNGRRIAVAPGFDPGTLRQLIDLVEERLCSD
jgi:hypothetical protein